MENAFKSLVFALALSLPAMAGQTHTNPKHGFQVTFPDKWIVGVVREDPDSVFGVSNDETSRANCGINAGASATTTGTTQAELNQVLAQPFGNAFWLSSVFKDGRDIKIEASGVRNHPTGIIAQEATANFLTGAAAAPVRLRMTVTILMAPGVNYGVVCTARAEGFEANRAAFRQIADSFRTKETRGLTTVEGNPPASDPAALPVASSTIDAVKVLGDIPSVWVKAGAGRGTGAQQ